MTLAPSSIVQMAYSAVVTGQPLASGAYTAKWREIGADWVIEAEIYFTTA